MLCGSAATTVRGDYKLTRGTLSEICSKNNYNRCVDFDISADRERRRGGGQLPYTSQSLYRLSYLYLCAVTASHHNTLFSLRCNDVARVFALITFRYAYAFGSLNFKNTKSIFLSPIKEIIIKIIREKNKIKIVLIRGNKFRKLILGRLGYEPYYRKDN